MANWENAGALLIKRHTLQASLCKCWATIHSSMCALHINTRAL